MKKSSTRSGAHKAALCTLLLFGSLLGTDIKPFISAQAITCNNSTATTIFTFLNNTTTVQIFVRSTSTAQAFTLTLPDSTTIEVPSGATLTLRFGGNLSSGSTIGTIITATGSAVLQVITMREVKQ